MKDIRKTILLCMIQTMITVSCFSQQQVKELKIGDTIPELIIKGLINRSSEQVNIADLYKEKLLIIDFWATWCVPCIEELKFLNELKKENPDKFNVLMVAYEDRNSIEKFLTKNSDIQTGNLFMATNDTLLKQLFPHRGLPHNIWIDQKGIVKAITYGGEVTKDNILNFGSSRASVLKTKADNLNFDKLKEFHLGDTIFTYRSIVTPFIDGISGGNLGGSTSGLASKRYFTWNATLLQILGDAYNLYYSTYSSPLLRYNLIEIHTNDSLKYFHPEGRVYGHLLANSRYKNLEDWKKENLFCYALTLPRRIKKADFASHIFDDMKRQFNVTVRIEPRNTLCIVVRKKPSKNLKSVSRDQNSRASITLLSPQLISIRNAKIGDVLNYLWGANLSNRTDVFPNPFVTEIKDSEDTCFDIDLDFSNEPNIKDGIKPDMIYRQLNKYGFIFKVKTKLYPIMVIDDGSK